MPNYYAINASMSQKMLAWVGTKRFLALILALITDKKLKILKWWRCSPFAYFWQSNLSHSFVFMKEVFHLYLVIIHCFYKNFSNKSDEIIIKSVPNESLQRMALKPHSIHIASNSNIIGSKSPFAKRLTPSGLSTIYRSIMSSINKV